MLLSSRRRNLTGGGGGQGGGHVEGEDGGEWIVVGTFFRGDGGISGGGGGTGSAGFGSQGGTLCPGPAIGVQQLGLQRRQHLNSLVTDDPRCQILLTWDGIQY